MDTTNETSEKTEAKGKTKKYRCKTKCFWNNTLWMEGDTIDVPEGQKLPEHFTEVK